MSTATNTFSTLTFVKNNLRSCLGEPHLNVCCFCIHDRDRKNNVSLRKQMRKY